MNTPQTINNHQTKIHAMKKAALITLLILLVACQPQSGTQPQQPQDFRTGTQAISLEFLSNLPPNRLFDRDPFNVVVQVENKGTSKIGGGSDRIYLSGFDHNIITGIGTDGKAIPILDGRGPYLPRGGFDMLDWKGTVLALTDKRIDKYQPTILATACYNYETVASGQACIDPNPFAAASIEKICTPTTVGLGSQGAPIAVSSISVEPAPGRTRFVISISNAGGGNVFKNGAQFLSKCSPYGSGLGYDEIDYVQVADVTLSGISIRQSCKPLDSTGHLRLSNGQAQLFCELSNIQGQSPYMTPINVILRYGYRQSISKQVEIRPLS